MTRNRTESPVLNITDNEPKSCRLEWQRAWIKAGMTMASLFLCHNQLRTVEILTDQKCHNLAIRKSFNTARTVSFCQAFYIME